ncbi:Acetyltransferase (GNAT) domain-containing protein [Friedmanniella luteola]|uniref:Acetyltransferase (GNAT) domain-containing protein n=1 Tax=Friedmanniella luteola TaxID=546871 RepID=A0A1H1V8M1_9ACTN|nr:GNAT family N-acetyltransferase [Friedmanniella luteola]SDS81104.1 Acetyltransferase (GNAT) domain-containing protein [Friedmanniella luteola]
MTGADPGPAPLLRGARPDDAEALGRCHLTCWAEAYGGLVDGDALAAALAAVDQRVDRWRQILAGEHGTTLAVAGEEVVGFVSAGPQRDDDLEGVELYALYVRRPRWGTGVGDRLLTAAVGDAACSLWVLRANVRARTFYARHGFRPDGAERVDDLLGGVAEIRMVRGAGTSPAQG